LGNLLRDRHRLEEAVASYHRALVLKPDYPEAYNNLGNALRDQGHLDEAIAAYQRALYLSPHYPEAHNNLADGLKERGQLDREIPAYRRALLLKPHFPEAHYNLGNALRDFGDLDEAVAAYRRALQLKPTWPEAYNNLGNALLEQGQPDEAIAAYRNALQLQSDFPEAHANLANALRDRGQFDEAIAAYRFALKLKPSLPNAHLNLGTVLREQGRLDEAVASYEHAIELQPDLPEAHNNLGNAFKDQGELDKTIDSFRHALELKPEHAWLHSNLIYALHFHPDYGPKEIDDERQSWDRQFGDPLKRFALPHINDSAPDRKLRIGYVSPNFRNHVVGRYVLPLFEHHDRERFEALCYSGDTRFDPLTARIRAVAGKWRSTVGVSDARLVEMIREDDVDILVDLTQHMAGNRLLVFARRPAPVQISFAGYPDSTGLEAIPYRISDRHLEAGIANEQPQGKEQVCLIDSFWCYNPCGIEVEITPLPSLTNGYVTFGCLNNFCKVNESVLRLWARVLLEVKNSRLVIASPIGSHRERTLKSLETKGIGAHRVDFVEFRPLHAYLQLYQKLDIALDTLPYNGGVTTCDALWMGIPVLTLPGKMPVSRAGLSILSSVGLGEFAAVSEEDYARIAKELTEDLPRLANLRATLRTRMRCSPLMDGPRFARNVEAAYRSMWQAWCAE